MMSSDEELVPDPQDVFMGQVQALISERGYIRAGSFQDQVVASTWIRSESARNGTHLFNMRVYTKIVDGDYCFVCTTTIPDDKGNPRRRVIGARASIVDVRDALSGRVGAPRLDKAIRFADMVTPQEFMEKIGNDQPETYFDQRRALFRNLATPPGPMN